MKIHPREIRIIGIIACALLVITMVRMIRAGTEKPKPLPQEPERAAVPINQNPTAKVDFKASMVRMRALARSSKGNFNSLPLADRTWLDGMTAHHSSEMMPMLYHHLLEEDRAEAASAKKSKKTTAKPSGSDN